MRSLLINNFRFAFVLSAASMFGEASVVAQESAVLEAPAAEIAVLSEPRGDEWWQNRTDSISKRAEEGNVSLAFLGDSITQGWEGNGKGVWKKFYGERQAMNVGIGGDRTEHLIWRLENGNWDDITPKVAVIMIGTNNTGHNRQDPKEVAAGIGRVLEVIEEKTPETKVLLLAIFPRGETPEDKLRLNNIAINKLIAPMADGEQVHYLDISEKFLDDDGTLPRKIMPDLLHLSEEGYTIWAESIEAKLVELGM